MGNNACASPTIVVGSDSWAPSTYAVDNVKPVIVAQANAQRRSVLIVCTADSLASVHVGDKGNYSTSIGGRSYPLAIGEGVTLNTTAEVYVIADAVAGATVKVIEEFGTA